MSKKNPSKKNRRPQHRADSPPQAAVVASVEPARVLAPVPEILAPGSLIPFLILIIVIGTWVLLAGQATIKGNEMSKYQAIFSATNAATLTGFQQARNPNDYTLQGQVLTLILMLAGIFFSFVAGGLAVIRIARMRIGDWQLAAWAIGSTAVVAIVGGLILRDRAVTASDDHLFFQAVYRAVSAFGNCGLFLGSLPDTLSLRVQTIMMPLSLLGGLGLPVLIELADWMRGKGPISNHSRTVLVWSAGAYAVITLLLMLIREPGIHADLPARQHAIAAASRDAINARSAGFPFEFASYLPSTAATLMIGIMIVGAGSGGTAGGLKLTTIAVITGGLRDLLCRRSVGRPLGIALLWTAVYLAMLLLSTFALLLTEPAFHLDRTLFLAASALGNVGLSHDPIVVSDAGLCVLSVIMLLGRVAPVLMLWHLFQSTPEATIATG